MTKFLYKPLDISVMFPFDIDILGDVIEDNSPFIYSAWAIQIKMLSADIFLLTQIILYEALSFFRHE